MCGKPMVCKEVRSPMSHAPLHPTWSSRIAFLLAAVGAAVGLGNIWKFPYMAGTQGGGAFVLVYLATIFAIAIPVAAAELFMGRSGGGNVVHSTQHLLKTHRRSGRWHIIGWVSLPAAFLLMTFYAVIAGWVLAYIWRTVSGQIADVTAQTSGAALDALLASPGEMIFWQAAFLALVGGVLARELRAGLERANLIMMPLLFVMLLVIAIYGLIAGDFAGALRFLFVPNFEQLSPQVLLSAIGHGFFSVGVGAAILLTYGAYLNDRSNLFTTAALIGLADTIIALLAGIGIFSIVFSQSLDPAQGPGLIFTTLPIAFAQLPGGQMFAFIFFVLLLFAAWTSALSLTEVVVAWLHEEWRMARPRAVALALSGIFLIGLLSVFSFNLGSEWRVPGFGERSLFDVKDFIVSNILLLVGGLLMIVFTSWALPAEASRREMGDGIGHFIWFWLSRTIAPLGILWVFGQGIWAFLQN